MKPLILIQKREGSFPCIVFDSVDLANEVYAAIYDKYVFEEYIVENPNSSTSTAIDIRSTAIHGRMVNSKIMGKGSKATDSDTLSTMLTIHPVQFILILLKEFGDKYIIRTNHKYELFEKYAISDTAPLHRYGINHLRDIYEVKTLFTKIKILELSKEGFKGP